MSPLRRSALPIALHRGLLLCCALFGGMGLLLTLAGSTALFAPWREAAARALLGASTLPPELLPFAALTDGILGGSIVGKWLAAAWLVRHPLARGERWAWSALVIGLLAWFGLDSAISIALGATFNVWMINLAPLLLFGGLLGLARRYTTTTPARPPGRAWRRLYWVCLVFASVGVVVALASHTAIFRVYQHAIADQWFLGRLPSFAIDWMRLTYGLIGATFLGHFLMLALALRHAVGQAWALEAVAVSMLGWFLVDASASAAHGGMFNVWMIDVPSLLAVAIPWWLARAELDPPVSQPD